MEDQITTSWYQQIPFIIVLIMALFGMVSGGFAAYFGRISQSKRAKLIEAIVLTFWSAIIPLLFGQAALSPIFGTVGFLLALFLSGGYTKYIYMFLGAAIGLMTGMIVSTISGVVDALIPLVEMPQVVHFLIIFLFTLSGVISAKTFKEYMAIISTSYAGASLFAFGFIALAFLVQDKSLLFIQNIAISALIPFIGGFFEEIEIYESVVYLFGFLLVGITGFIYQRRILQAEFESNKTANK